MAALGSLLIGPGVFGLGCVRAVHAQEVAAPPGEAQPQTIEPQANQSQGNQPQASEPQAEVNPPERVGAVVRLTGTVSYHTADQDSWSPATLNYPVTSGDSFWTQPGSEAGLSLSDTRLVLAPTTELDVGVLDTQTFAATLPQGQIYLRIRNLLQGESYVIATPRGSVAITSPGRYLIVAGTTATPTLVTVLEGAAAISQGVSLEVPAGQTAEITGEAAPFQGQLVAAARDAFLSEMLARERPAVARAPVAQPVAVPQPVYEMPGGEELSEYGAWSQTPDYGPVWYPQVSPDWTPYSVGHWAYVGPWGWTWVDAEPWGFAPFHYGRWAEFGGRWGWTPGINAAVVGAPIIPVYAPALVAFFGLGGGGPGPGPGYYGGRVGWVPLGPGEAYRPWFRANPTYVRNVNIRQVTNFTEITNVHNTVNNVTINQFRNVRAATVIPAAAMATSRPVQQVVQRVPAQQLAQTRPVFGRPPVPPTTATLGVTPRIAQQIHAVAPPAGAIVPQRPRAPGPVIRAQAPAAGAVPGAIPGAAPAAVRPGLEAARPGQPARPGEPRPPSPAHAGTLPPPAHAGEATLAHPGAPGVPALRTPESGRTGPPPVPPHERAATPVVRQGEPGHGIQAEHALPSVITPHNGPVGTGAQGAAPEPHVAGPAPAPTPQTHVAGPASHPPGEPHVLQAAPHTPPLPHAAPTPQHPGAPNEPRAALAAPHPAPHPAPAPHYAAVPVPHAPPPPAPHVPPPAAPHYAAAAPVPHPAPPPAPHVAPPPMPHVAAAAPVPHAAPPPAPHPPPAAHPQEQQRKPGQPG